jgi:hypothetical protein
MDKIENGNIVKQNKVIIDGIDTTFINYENQIYIFTDGYLEYYNAKTNRQFHFGSPEIDNVRKFCIANNVDIKTALEKDKNLGLPAYPSPQNQYIYLHILETHERDYNKRINTYDSHKEELQDNKILKAVWQKWANESEFKQPIEWKKY